MLIDLILIIFYFVVYYIYYFEEIMKEKIIFTGNCAWCLEAMFLRTRGVLEVESGFYSLEDYPEIAFSKTDKLEAVQLTYDNLMISFEDLLSVYFITHNPTVNSWSAKESFYPLCRPAVFYFTEEQKDVLLEKMQKIQPEFELPLLTQVKQFKPDNFTLVEEKYRRFYENNPKDGYCLSIIDSKLAKMKESLKHLFINLEVKGKD